MVSVCSVLHREDAQGLILIGQPAHAWVSGQLARAWGNDRFGGFEPWEEVCLAAEQHDIGMAAWDAAPDLSPASGLPYSFRELPRSTHLALWASAASLVLPQSRYAALLVSLHGTGLYEPADRENGAPSDDPAVVEFLSRQRVLQDELLGSLRADDRYAPYATAGVLARNRRLVAWFDGISLALCHGLRSVHAHEGVPTASGEVTVVAAPVDAEASEYTVDPWPFRDPSVALVYEGRRLTQTFTSRDEMRHALARAPWLVLETRLRPTGGGALA